MATGAQHVDFQTKRLLGLSDFREKFFDYLVARQDDIVSRIFRQGGVFADTIALSADGADKFKMDVDKPGTDGVGHVLTPTTALGTLIQFENTLSTDYFVALTFAERPRGITVNPRTGNPEFNAFEETIGDRGDPTSVTDLGGTLEFDITSVVQSGVSFAGRKCLVWKKVPGKLATSEAVAVEELTVVFSGGVNKITTTGVFGQQGTPSTTAADYQVLLLGPTVRTTDLTATLGIEFIGKVTGAGAGNPPTTFDISAQRRIDSTLNDVDDVTRVDAHGFLKISVQADALDVDENQIEVLDSAGTSVMFSVDEDGDVVIEGNLTVKGTETVDLTEVVKGNNQIGDADGDSHTIQGTLTHSSTAFGGNPFVIDGTSGDIQVNGKVSTNIEPTLAGVQDLGALANRWSNLFVSSLVRCDSLAVETEVVTDLLPDLDATRDLGAVGLEWQDLHVTGTAFLDLVDLSTATNEGFNSSVYPESDAAHTLGADGRSWLELHLADHLQFNKGGLDTDAIIFEEGATQHFRLRTEFATVTDADHALALVDGSGNVIQRWIKDGEVRLNRDVLDTGQDPTAADRQHLIIQNTGVVGHKVVVEGLLSDERGFLWWRKRLSNSIDFFLSGQTTGPNNFHVFHANIDAEKVKLGVVQNPTTGDLDDVPKARLEVRGDDDAGASFFNNACVVRHINGPNSEVGFAFAAGVLGSQHPSDNWVMWGANERKSSSWHYGTAMTDANEYIRMEIRDETDANIVDASGLAVKAGRNFTTPDGATAAARAMQLVGWNQNKAIAARGFIDGLLTPAQLVPLSVTNDQFLNVDPTAGVGIVDNGTGDYSVVFDEPLENTYTILCQIAGPTGVDNLTLNVESITGSGFDIHIRDTSTGSFEDEQVFFLVIGRPATAPA